MRHVVFGIVALALATIGRAASAEDTVRVAVGKTTRWSPGFAIVMTVCDDTSLATIDPAGDALMFTGKKPGKTQCAFYRTQAEKRLVTIEVVEPEGAGNR